MKKMFSLNIDNNFQYKDANSDSLIRESGRKPIKDRGINWKESYHDKTVNIKKKFDKEVGPDSYIRYEGHDFTTNSDYYIVVGPSIHKARGKVFFAGIKKLPDYVKDRDTKTYAPYGEYFNTHRAAQVYASERWGVPIKKEAPRYDVNDLVNADIPRHIKG